MSRSAILRAVATKLFDPAQPILGAPIRAAYGDTDPDASQSGNGYYRAIGGGAYTRDLPQGLRAAFIEREMEFADTYPLAVRGLSLMAEYVKPGRSKPKAKHPIVDKVVQDFWKDPRNAWQSSAKSLAQTAWITGDLFLPCRVNPINGAVVRDYWDPAHVTDVRFHPASNRIVTHVFYKPPAASTGAWYPVVRPVLEQGPHFGRLMGADPRAVRVAKDATSNAKWTVYDRLNRELWTATTEEEAKDKLPVGGELGVYGVLAFRFNARENSKFGRGDFMACMDGWSQLGDLHAGWAERAQIMARLWGSLEVKASAGKVEDAIARIARHSPMYASLLVHNEGEVPNISVPSTNAGDAETQERMLRLFYSSPLGIGAHILTSDFSQGNRAISEGTEDPTYLRALDKQDDYASVIEIACRYAVDSAFTVDTSGKFAEVDSWEIDVERPSLIRKDPVSAASAIGTLGSALDLGIDRQLVSTKAARGVFVKALSDAGADGLDLETIETEIAEEARSGDPATQAKYAEIARRLAEQGAIPEAGASPVASEAPVEVARGVPADDPVNRRLLMSGIGQIVADVVAERIPRDAGVALLVSIAGLAPSEAEGVMGTAGAGFKPTAKQEPEAA